jgi:AcrR family transcriptional regulator
MSRPLKKPNPAKRKYDSTRRQAQAEETRHRILDAAHKLFMEHGYAGATIDSISKEAGVALKTVYAAFENKHNILIELLNRSSSNRGEADTPMLERASVKAVTQERDPQKQLKMFAQVIAGNLEGAAAIAEIMNVAAKTEADINELVQKLNKQRWQNMAFAVKQFAANGTLREKDEKSATDTVWTLTSPEVFLLLTRERGWSAENYSNWLADKLIRTLLP